MSTILKDPDTITSEDLPSLRADMRGYADNEMLSGEFRAVCRDAIDAIDQARDEDPATHAVLKAALDRLVRVGNNEMLLHDDCLEVGAC